MIGRSERIGPLVWFGVHDEPVSWPTATMGQVTAHWRQTLDHSGFDASLMRILDAIANGEVYQVNLTAPPVAAFHGDVLALFAA